MVVHVVLIRVELIWVQMDKGKERLGLKFNIGRRGLTEFAFVAGAFLAARALIFDAAAPFALAYIAAFLFKGNKFYATAIFASLGIISSFRADFSMKYLLAIIILCVGNLFLSVRPKMAAGTNS